jgi:hypothetical protein
VFSAIRPYASVRSVRLLSHPVRRATRLPGHSARALPFQELGGVS